MFKISFKEISIKVLIGVFFALPFFVVGSANAQTCNGICINVNAASGGGGGGTSYTYPTNLSLNVDEGSACTENRTVTLEVTYSNAADILISNDENFDDDTWVSLNGYVDQDNILYGENGEVIRTAAIDWTLTEGDGQKNIYVRFRSSSKNVALATLSDEITLDERTRCGEETDDHTDDTVQDGLVKSGMLIKGEHFPQVYFVNDRLERRPFYTEGIYFTYRTSFDDVVTVPDEELAKLPIGRPMLPKMYHVLVKLPTDPRVYYVVSHSSNPELAALRWITSENVAEENFGYDWQKYVIDIPIPLFPHFERGADIVTYEGIDTSLLINKIYLTGDMYTTDTDGDGLIDFIELEYGSDATLVDTDEDRLTDDLEVFYHTDPRNVDTDGDGFFDGDEVRDGFNPQGQGALDSDKDGLTDPMEFAYGTDRYKKDTDGDGYSDSFEIEHGFDPNGFGLLPTDISGFGFTRYVISAIDLAILQVGSFFNPF